MMYRRIETGVRGALRDLRLSICQTLAADAFKRNYIHSKSEARKMEPKKDEIEITDAMIYAGMDAYQECVAEHDWMANDRAVRLIYRAMFEKRPLPMK